MSLSTLTLALAAFNQAGVRAINVGKSNPNFYHIYYHIDGKNRVMLVPRETKDFEKLQSEVTSLVCRTSASQNQIGYKDAPFAK